MTATVCGHGKRPGFCTVCRPAAPPLAAAPHVKLPAVEVADSAQAPATAGWYKWRDDNSVFYFTAVEPDKDGACKLWYPHDAPAPELGIGPSASAAFVAAGAVPVSTQEALNATVEACVQLQMKVRALTERVWQLEVDQRAELGSD